jgi:hypothetical protein
VSSSQAFKSAAFSRAEFSVSDCMSLNESLFVSYGHLKKIDGFVKCSSLYQIQVLSSVEIISQDVLCECMSLNEVTLVSDCHLKRTDGFVKCSLWDRITASVRNWTGHSSANSSTIVSVHPCGLRPLFGLAPGSSTWIKGPRIESSFETMKGFAEQTFLQFQDLHNVKGLHCSDRKLSHTNCIFACDVIQREFEIRDLS